MNINISAHSNHNYAKPGTQSSAKALRAAIIKAMPSLSESNKKQEWWLLGTSNCHLCEQAEALMKRFQAVQPITYQHVDIADFDETLMMAFATTIPVILTENKRLNYPFSVMDLQQLLDESS
ncbi:glutaredoxin family protein [Psychrobacter jeotgali]|uniref:glutaredoxin family protein n=1 Tax=Psychrobacter jeotgali TaxID=179010 RepID=UPI001D0F6CC9|nr:glutaredoxin family protein [Psychrobacter jeotgali]